MADMGKFNEELTAAGIMLAGEGLQASSHGARVAFSGKKRTVIDGPFAETKELVAGFWLWKVKSLEEAIEWVKRCPNPHEEDCEIEIRPLFGADDFGDAFTPELREQEAAIRAKNLGLGPARFEQGRERTVAGLNKSYTPETRSGIGAQWDRFAPQIGKVSGQVGKDAYGVCHNSSPDCRFEYLTGVEVSDSAKLPADFEKVKLPAGRYAVITHEGHVSELPKAIDTIWSTWVPDSGLKTAKAPCFERYTEDFNPKTGRGGTEIWILLEG